MNELRKDPNWQLDKILTYLAETLYNPNKLKISKSPSVLNAVYLNSIGGISFGYTVNGNYTPEQGDEVRLKLLNENPAATMLLILDKLCNDKFASFNDSTQLYSITFEGLVFNIDLGYQ